MLRLTCRALILAAFFSSHTLHTLLGNYGYAAVFLFVGIESLGIPFPGETMVIVAATYAGATHRLTVWLIWLTAAAGAIIGDNIGFAVGHWGGYRLIRRYGQKVRLSEAKLKVGRLIFDRHGGKVVFFGRFVSVLRTYAAFLAGTTRMPYLRFLFFNAAGGIVWSGIYAVGFYYLGSALEHVRGPVDYGLGGVAAVVVIAFIVWLRRNEKRLEGEAERMYPGSLDDYEPGRREDLDDAQEDQQPDHDQHQGGESVAPPLKPLSPNLVATPRGGQRQPNDRADRDGGEDDQRPDGGRHSDGGGGQENGEDRQVGGGSGPEGDHHGSESPEP
jgi:membrane protein DedA with SNARE-associated domain